MIDTSIFVNQIVHSAEKTTLRTGQALFNHLPFSAAQIVSGTLWDPFHRDLTREEIQEWVDHHLIFGDQYYDDIIGLFNGEQLLWYMDLSVR